MTQTTGKQPERARVLVIDDEEIVHASVKRILARLDLTTEAVYTAKEGLEKIRSGQFDLVITDLMMPEMTGLELLEALQADPLSVPILMITGYPTIRTAVQALRLGAADYIAKPFTRKELLSPVKRALRLEHSTDRRAARPAPPVEGLETGACVFLPHHAWARYEEDGTFRVGIEASFLAAVGRVASIESAEEMELVKQGFVGIKLRNDQDEVHAVVMPLSGQVLEIHQEMYDHPDRITAREWILRLFAPDLDTELPLLARRDA